MVSGAESSVDAMVPGDGTDRDPDGNDGAADAPLASLARSIADQGNGHAGDVWSELGVSGMGSGDIWERLAETPEDRGVPGDPDLVPDDPSSPRGWLPAYPSRRVVIAHGVVTAAVLGVAAALYLGAALDAVPRRFWILSLPPLAAGLFLLAPIVAWILGLWNPEELS